jgi:hypothetical protein
MMQMAEGYVVAFNAFAALGNAFRGSYNSI